MSLIHDALKKTEKEKKQKLDLPSLSPEGNKGNEEQEKGQSKNTRVTVLVAVLLVVLVGVAYLRIIRPAQMKSPEAVSSSLPEVSTQVVSKEQLWTQAEEIFVNQDWRRGREVFQKLILVDPTNPEVYNNLGVAYKKTGATKEAYKQYEKALAIQPDYPEALNNLGSLLLADLRLSEARQKLEKAIQIKGDYPDPYFNLGIILEAQGDNKGAIVHYEDFLRLADDLDLSLRRKIKQRLKLLKRRL